MPTSTSLKHRKGGLKSCLSAKPLATHARDQWGLLPSAVAPNKLRQMYSGRDGRLSRWRARRRQAASSQRDLDADIWTASWGTRRMKPWSLLRWATQQLLFSKVEKGHCYYSSQPLSASRLVAELQAHCTLQDFYSRLPLLASPSTPYDLGDVAVHIVGDIKTPKGDVLTDGFAEISLKLARKLNLVSGEQVRQGVYDAYQFRGLARDAATGDALIVKGMFVVIETDEDVMYIRKSCEKIRFKPSAEFSSFSQELDVVQSTATPRPAQSECTALRGTWDASLPPSHTGGQAEHKGRPARLLQKSQGRHCRRHGGRKLGLCARAS